MKAYRLSVNLKLGLIILAVIMAVTSLVYTNSLVNRLRERESNGMEVWAEANELLVKAPSENPYQEALRRLGRYLENADGAAASPAEMAMYKEAVAWARTMPPDDQINFVFDITSKYYTDVPAVITDSSNWPQTWRNLSVADSLPVSASDSMRVRRRVDQMAEVYEPIPIEIEFGFPGPKLKQFVYYDESELIRELRIYPYLQLLFVGLFILVGYLGFSYVRRSEQSSLWVGMAREAAHQLGTPISSLMGWLELLRQGDMPPEAHESALDEVEKDIERLSRVANRFNDIGSLPKLEAMPLAPFIAHTADYIRRRFPQKGVSLDVAVPEGLRAPLNAQLFEWVIENLLKNALDAIEKSGGQIHISAQQENERIYIDVSDNGKGIDRRQWKNVFRPGYSTKKRGWGLGLSLAKRIVEDYHGGSLTLAQSKPGQGATFRIELPAA